MNTNLSKRLLTALLLFSIVIVAQSSKPKKPKIIGTSKQDKLVTSKSWQLVGGLSDEFNAKSLSKSRWDTRSKRPGFSWYGRFPGLFQKENIQVKNHKLYMEAKKYATPVRAQKQNWTHGGAIIRSNAAMQVGMYTECSMKTTETIMSGTFWMQTNSSVGCEKRPMKELDVTESIGRAAKAYKPLPRPTPKNPDPKHPPFYKKARAEFLRGMNSNARERNTDCNGEKGKNRPVAGPRTFDPSEKMHTYGFYWESPTKLHFYCDGKYMDSAVPSIPFKDPMHLIMALEIYDFNYPSNKEKDGFNLSYDKRCTQYEWVRTWKVRPRATETNNKNIDLTYDNDTPVSINITDDNVLHINGLAQEKEISIYSMLGTKLISTKTKADIDVHSLSSGIYMLHGQDIEPIQFIKE